ncbi:Hypothetical protein LUCI_0810 [Lucifera butyrica]|uniref:Uncharacterized protein n=1 Tax=Lucifera butyrica TaxID=1351585 RepID=A0A498R464_9FIRM|nr:hypothetical protein [Lucifera butyrica]VBB05600.1 Hypothetical protein LUCI_0810 [Lucifera butyrica]
MVIDLDEKKLKREIIRELSGYPVSEEDQEKIAEKVMSVILRSCKVIKK